MYVIQQNCLRILCGLMLMVSTAYATDTIWDVMRTQFRLDHAVTHPRVQQQLRWLLSHPHYLEQLAQAEPYIYHIVNELNKQQLPGEIALIPMVESAYNPFAYSGMGAAGLWQFMPDTAQSFGLQQDWWSDNRRSILSSTKAALSYLQRLQQLFNHDWLLAFAAYDAGEGKIMRLSKNKQGGYADFWTLNVPEETKQYVPRLLALAEIIQHPQHYHIQLPAIPSAPYFSEVTVAHQIDLNQVAKLANISYQELIKLNPGYNRWLTTPNSRSQLLIPSSHVAEFYHNLQHQPVSVHPRVTRQTMPQPSSHHNQLQHAHTKPTTPLPASNRHAIIHNPIGPRYQILHIVQMNERITALANKYQVSTANIRRWNQLTWKNELQVGQQLIIWKNALDPSPVLYRVKEGDSITTIAALHGLSVETLLRYNPILTTRVLHPGQLIKVNA